MIQLYPLQYAKKILLGLLGFSLWNSGALANEGVPSSVLASADLSCSYVLRDRQDVFIDQVAILEDRLASLEVEFRNVPRAQSGIDNENVLALIAKFREILSSIFAAWDGTPQSDGAFVKSLSLLTIRIQRIEDLNLLCQRRDCAKTFPDVRDEPTLLMPNRIYEVKTDRGPTIKVRFNRDVVESYFWEVKNSKLADAAKKSLEAVGRGLYPDSTRNASGIAPMFFDMPQGLKWVKIHITGGVSGSVRVYGILYNDIYNFVLFEDESKHDARYLSRVSAVTAERFLNEKWK